MKQEFLKAVLLLIELHRNQKINRKKEKKNNSMLVKFHYTVSTFLSILFFPFLGCGTLACTVNVSVEDRQERTSCTHANQESSIWLPKAARSRYKRQNICIYFVL